MRHEQQIDAFTTAKACSSSRYKTVTATLTTSATIRARDHLFTFAGLLVLQLVTEAEVAVFTATDGLTGRRRRRRRRCRH